MKRLVLGVIVIAMVSSVCFAETDKGRWENLQKLKPGKKVQVMDVGAIVREGKLKEVTSDQIVIEVKKNAVVIPRDDVSRVVLKKSRTPRILMGLGIGAAVGLAVLGGTTGEDSYYEALVVGLPLLTGGGGAVGALLPTSSVIYQRP